MMANVDLGVGHTGVYTQTNSLSCTFKACELDCM